MSLTRFLALIAAAVTISLSDAVADPYSCASLAASADKAITLARETTSVRGSVETFNALAPLIEGACISENSLSGETDGNVSPTIVSGPGPQPEPTTPPHPSPTPTQSPNCKEATNKYLRMQSMLANAKLQLDELKDALKAKERQHRLKKPAVDKLTEQHRITEALYANAVKRIAALYPKWESTLHLYKHWDGSWSGWISKYPKTDWVRILDKYEDDLHAISQKLTPLLAELNTIGREIVTMKAQIKKAESEVIKLERLKRELLAKMTSACRAA